MNAFQKWMASAPTAQKRRLARIARTTLGTLRQVAGAYRTKGRVSTSPELARRVEIAAAKIGAPQFRREELSAACRGCEFAKRCRE